MIIKELFPVVIGVSNNPDQHVHQKKLIDHCINLKKQISSGGENWLSKLYNTHGTHDIHKDENFYDVGLWIFNEVKNYFNKVGFQNKNFICTKSWFNFFEPNDYQEKHDHGPNDDISVVYYLKTSKNCGDLILHTHEPASRDEFDPNNPLTFKMYKIQPKDGLLVCFKSNLFHSVLQNKSEDNRISLAFNFKIV